MKRLFPLVAVILLWLCSAQAQNPQPGAQTPPDQGVPAASSSSNDAASPAADQPASPSSDAAAAPDGANGDRQAGSAANQSQGNATDSGETTTPAENSQPATPHTEMIRSTDADSTDPISDAAPLPKNKLTLIGGTAKKVDMVRDRVLVQTFGGGPQMNIQFDERTEIYRDGRRTTVLGIHRGDRIYADTMTLGPQVYARSLRVESASGPAEAHGQIVAYDPQMHLFQMRDSLTSQSLFFSVSGGTTMKKPEGTATVGDLIPGTLLDIVFSPGRQSAVAQYVSIQAVPGSNYLFVGRVTNLNLSRGLLALDNASDGKNYELRFDPALIADRQHLVIGALVSANTRFDGRGYYANSLSITEAPADTAER